MSVTSENDLAALTNQIMDDPYATSQGVSPAVAIVS
jgi:hypothetical protein